MAGNTVDRDRVASGIHSALYGLRNGVRGPLLIQEGTGTGVRGEYVQTNVSGSNRPGRDVALVTGESLRGTVVMAGVRIRPDDVDSAAGAVVRRLAAVRGKLGGR